MADAAVTPRLLSVTAWRSVGGEVWRAAGIEASIEPVEPARTAPWVEVTSVEFDLEAGAHLPPGTSAEVRRRKAAAHLESLPQQATWVWTDGSATAGVLDGGAGVLIEWPDGSTHEISAPAGALCSSYRAEMVALREALGYLRDHPAHTDSESLIVVCTDSQAALSALRSGQCSPWAGLALRAMGRTGYGPGLGRKFEVYTGSGRAGLKYSNNLGRLSLHSLYKILIPC